MSAPHRVAFGLLFLASGALGLVYEVLWQRALSLSFGVTGFAISVILAAYMTGLALGTSLGGRVAARLKHPARVYGALEILIGLYALTLPALMSGATTLYRWVYLGLEPGPVVFGLIQGAILMVLLLIPTTMMGATFPLLVEAVVPSNAAAGARVGWLYAANCGGAVLGTMAGGFLLLPELGHSVTLYVAVAGSLTVGGLAILLSHLAHSADWSAVVELPPEPPPPRASGAPPIPWVLLAGALSGGAAMIYEVAWTRLLALQMGSSVYAFTTMLATFLLGLAIGGAVAGAVLGRYPGAGVRGFVAAQTLALVGVGVSCVLFPDIPPIYVRLYHSLGAGGTAFGAHVLLASAVMLAPTLAMGAALPFLMAVAAGGEGDVARPVSRLYVSNTVGAVVGTLAAGFGLLPTLGVLGTITLGMALTASGLLAVALPEAPGARRGMWVVALGAGALIFFTIRPVWDPLLMAAGLYKHVSELKEAETEDIVSFAHNNLDLIYYGEGLNSAVTVGRSQSSGALWLANNGKVDASSVGDLATQLMLAHTPMAAHPAPDDVLVIGLASGITLGGITGHPAKKIDVLEIEEHIIAASHFFDEHNNRPLEDPRVNVILADARNHLLLTDDTWDVIISEPSNPWISGVSNLFTLEFFELAKARLNPGGLLCQWVQLYELPPRDLRAILRTLHTVFPEVMLAWSIDDGDLLVIAGESEVTLRRERLEALLANPSIAESLARIDVTTVDDWLVWYHMGTDELELMVAGEQGLNTDDNAYVEFRAPLFLGLSTSQANARELLEWRAGPEGLITEGSVDPALYHGLAEAYLKANLFRLARDAMGRYVAAGGPYGDYLVFLERVEEAFDTYPYTDPSEP